MKKTQLRLRYYKLPLPPEGDSSRVAAESVATARARGMADSLSAGTLPDSSATTLDTGLFDVPGLSVPGLARMPGLLEALGRADTVASARVVGPFTATDGVILGAIVDRKPRHLPPLLETLGAVKRRADAEKRKAAVETDRQAFYQAHRESYRGRRAAITRLTWSEADFTPRVPAVQDVERWYQLHGRMLFGQPDSSRAWIPSLGDSLREVVGTHIQQEDRERWRRETLQKLTAGLRAGRDARAVARGSGAVAETLSLAAWDAADSLFLGPVADSILVAAPEQKGVWQGPRTFGRHTVLWRVDAADTSYLPPFERVRRRVEREFSDERRRRDEDEGRAWFDRHRDRYVMPVQHAIEYVQVVIPLPDSVRISEAELRAYYARKQAGYRQEEEVHARHILISARENTNDAAARTRADSLQHAVQGGADFVELARRFSQEPGAPGSGGDLGWFGRGRMVKEFETAAFALEPGKVSPVVKTQFGYHIIKLEERKAAGTKPFDEVRGEIRSFLGGARADSNAARAAAVLRRKLALGGGASALAAYGGTRTTEPFEARQPVPGLGVVQGLGEDLDRLPAGRWAPRVYRTARAYLVVRPLRSLPSRPAEFEQVTGRAVEDARNARREELLEKKAAALRAAIAAGATLDSLSAPYGGLKDSGPLTRGFGFVPGLGNEPRVLEKAFTLQPGGQSDTLQTAQGRVWIRVETRRGGDETAFEAARESLSQEMLKKSMDEWFEARRKSMKIEVLRPDLREPAAPPLGSPRPAGR